MFSDGLAFIFPSYVFSLSSLLGFKLPPHQRFTFTRGLQFIVLCFTRQRDNNNVDSPDLTRKFIGTIVEITHNRYNTQFRV
jgi:hypothetical protein